MIREEIEAALDDGDLWVKVSPTKYWKVRRNGVTKRWKRDVKRYAIPCKAGFRLTFSITDFNAHKYTFAVSKIDPNAQGEK